MFTRAPAVDTLDEEEKLVARAQQDPAAFGELYERHVHMIYRFVYNRVHNREAAEDLTSEIFYKALRSIDRYRPAGPPFRAWLYQIATNATIDHLRTRRPVVDLDQVSERADRGVGVEEQIVRRAEVARVRTALAKLTEAQRMAVSLKLGQDMRTGEIALQMGRSTGAVKVLINHGLAAIRRQLEPMADAREDWL